MKTIAANAPATKRSSFASAAGGFVSTAARAPTPPSAAKQAARDREVDTAPHR